MTRFRVAPMRLMAGTIVIILLQWLAAIQWQQSQPYFQLPIKLSHEQTILISHQNEAPRKITHVEANGIRLPLPAESLIPDPDYFQYFAQLNAFYAQQDRLFDLLAAADTITLWDSQGNSHRYPKVAKTLILIPIEFWAYQSFGALALLIGIAFWVFHRNQAVPRIILLAGVGFAVMQWTMSLYSTRELALPLDTFRHLIIVNHLGGKIFATSIVILLLYFPCSRPLPWLMKLSVGSIVFIWLNDLGQWVEWPINLCYFPSLLLFPTFIILAWRQFILCRFDSNLRRQLLWILGTILCGLGVAFALYIVPLLITGTSWLSLCLTNGIALLVFIGFVLGVQRHELFGIHRWWLRSWIVSAALLVLIVMDLSAVATFSHQASIGLGLVSFALSWLYLPLRQWGWRWYLGRCLGWCLPNKSSANNARPDTELNRLQQTLLQNLKPLHFARCKNPPPQIMQQQGLVMAVNPPDSGEYWIFTGKARGFELFSQQDVLQTQRQIVNHRAHSKQHTQTQQQLQAERTRIMRDLHDDVAADLLTLMHQAEDDGKRNKVRDTLNNLRSIIYSLQPSQALLLSDCCWRWQEDCLQRCRAAGVALDWQQADDFSALTLTTPGALHLQRILREAISNALKHSQPSAIQICLQRQDSQLTLIVIDNGSHLPIPQWQPGKGLSNVQHRAAELGGKVSWFLSIVDNIEYCHCNVQIPLTSFTRTTEDNNSENNDAQHIAA